MNVLEHYIVEVHSVKELPLEYWMDDFHVEVHMTSNCHGHERFGKHIFTISQWEHIKQRGYYMG